VLRRTFGRKREEDGESCTMRSFKIISYPSPTTVRRIRCTGHVEQVGEIRNAYKILVRKYEGKTPLGRPKHKWENNFIIDLGKLEWKGVDWIQLDQDRNQ
jgi:hypothetical protein